MAVRKVYRNVGLGLLGLLGIFTLFHLPTSSNPRARRSPNADTPATPNTATPVKQILMYTPRFGDITWGGMIPLGGPEPELTCSNGVKCRMSTNKTGDLQRYDALVFHNRDAHTPPEKRLSNQVYLMFCMESPSYQEAPTVKGGKFYNWTQTYSMKSTLGLPYALTVKRAQKDVSALKPLTQLQKKRDPEKAMIAWIVSHCGGANDRFKYLAELKKHIKVDVFGKCGTPCPEGFRVNNKNCFDSIAQSGQYKFYLAFENSMCEQYITLKPFRALNNTMLPILLGGKTKEDYNTFLPENSYLDVRDYASPKKLADYLKHLDENDKEYLKYFEWRQYYWVHEGSKNGWCQFCDALHDEAMINTPRNVDWAEHWNEATNCDNTLVKRILSGKL